MSSNLVHTLSEPEYGSSSLNDHPAIEGARAQLRAMLIEGAVSPKTTLLNDSFRSRSLDKSAKKRMRL
jgi:hypothetical protein